MAWPIAGDTLHVVPENDNPCCTQCPLVRRYHGRGRPATASCAASKSVLRELARLGGSETLKGLLKVSQKRELDAYLHGLDLLDVQ